MTKDEKVKELKIRNLKLKLRKLRPKVSYWYKRVNILKSAVSIATDKRERLNKEYMKIDRRLAELDGRYKVIKTDNKKQTVDVTTKLSREDILNICKELNIETKDNNK